MKFAFGGTERAVGNNKVNSQHRCANQVRASKH